MLRPFERSLKYTKGWENLVFRSVKRPKSEMAKRSNFWPSRKHSGFVIYSYFKDSAFTAVKKIVQCSSPNM